MTGPSGDAGPPGSNSTTVNQPQTSCGSVINVDRRTVGESIPLVGVPFRLSYSSGKVAGNISNFQALIPVTMGSPASNLVDIYVHVNIDGEVYGQDFPMPVANQNYLFTWDGHDGSGHNLNTSDTATVYRTETYSPTVGGLPVSYAINVGAMVPNSVGLGGWSLNILHSYDTHAQVMYMGDGSTLNAAFVASGINYMVASPDSKEIFIFNSNGQILQTLDSVTGATKYYLAAVQNPNSELTR